MPFTTFPHEIVHLSLDTAEHLLSAHVYGQRRWIATDGFITDYPILDNGRVFWDTPEAWTEEFKEACASFILTSNLALIEREYRRARGEAT
jgi:hypothetical protein